ncbi:glycoside hydrolase family 13 protein [Sorangium sp. So ce385]|uniref:glycoside hydrolase family 13 protein n=1 Tax=Sorangium sp. So ce385 TaxID=3133308 RepID=UPI003F5C1C7E
MAATTPHPTATVPSTSTAAQWWRNAVIYQIYLPSFADGDGDGIGDLAGVRSRLPYLASLGVDALWFTPWYPSPMADGGYDVADYRDVAPVFGTLAEAERLIAEALELGIRTIIDVIPNHVSSAHPWFRAALAAQPGSQPRSLFHFRPGRGPDGGLPPNDWPSEFGGSAWSRSDGPAGAPAEWYLHLFSPEQPDLNWASPAVRAEHEDVLRFWYDRGVAGVRVDSASLLTKDPALPDLAANPDPHPYIDREDVHDIYRSWRRIADSYAGERFLVGELWLDDPRRLIRFLRADELHTAFNLAFLRSAWDAAGTRACIDATLAAHAAVGAPATWVLCNHDVTRTVTRYGRMDTSFDFATKAQAHAAPVDLALGARRARAAALLTLALPGSVYLYQGEELGLPEVEDLPPGRRRDPMHIRSGGTDPGRDGCRVPLPWSGAAPPFGFTRQDAEPWLPQPPGWGALTVEAQDGVPGSMLELYRAALRLRRSLPALRDSALEWLSGDPGVLAFARGGLRCMVNMSSRSLPVPAGYEVLLTSHALDCRRPGDLPRLPPDTAVWLTDRRRPSLSKRWSRSGA